MESFREFVRKAKAVRVANLTPITSGDAFSPTICHMLAHWRNKRTECFPSQFHATWQSTSGWMFHLHENPDRVIWWTMNEDRVPFGTVGLLGRTTPSGELYLELDHILRGTKGGSMREAIRLLEGFAKSFVPTLHLRVLSTNLYAINYYKYLGYNCIQHDSYQIIKKDGKAVWEPAPEPTGYTMLTMSKTL